MSTFSAEELLSDLPGDEPCGPDMEYDPLFQEMERAAEGKPEQVMGDSVVAAEEPDWRTVKKNALEILSKSKDLRAATYLAHAALHIDGWSGLGEGLKLVEGLIRQYWADVHPVLDPDDDNDPTFRINTLNSLSAESTVLASCQRVPLVSAKGVGQFSLRDLRIASGDISWPEKAEGEPPSTAIIDAAFMQSELEDLQATATALAESYAATEGIDAAIAEHLPPADTPDLSGLKKMLSQVTGEVNQALERRGVTVEGAPGEEGGDESAGAAVPQAGISGTVQSREDVIKVIDQVCEFYRRSEPSSPVPLLLERARKLVNMDFMEVIRNISPSGVSEVENLRGPEE